MSMCKNCGMENALETDLNCWHCKKPMANDSRSSDCSALRASGTATRGSLGAFLWSQNLGMMDHAGKWRRLTTDQCKDLAVEFIRQNSREGASDYLLHEMLINDNRAMREAGCELAEAAMRVIREHDGCHRLMLAASKWATTIANEGGREKLYQQNAKGQTSP